jgi:hypothetical protein
MSEVQALAKLRDFYRDKPRGQRQDMQKTAHAALPLTEANITRWAPNRGDLQGIDTRDKSYAPVKRRKAATPKRKPTPKPAPKPKPAAPKPKSASPKPKPAAPKPAAPKPKSASPKPKPSAPKPKSASPKPKPAAPKPKSASPKPAALVPVAEKGADYTPVRLTSLASVCTHFRQHPNTPEQVTNMRAQVAREWKRRTGKPDNFTSVTAADLQTLTTLIDDVYMGGKLHQALKDSGSTLTVTPNHRMTKTGGVCKMPRRAHGHGTARACAYTIELATKVLAKTFTGGEACHRANGVVCCNRLMCTMLVLEHELVHLLNGTQCNGTQHDQSFQNLARWIFGHTEFRHELLKDAAEVDRAKARGVDLKATLKKGDAVEFKSRGGETVRATVTALHAKRFSAHSLSPPIRQWKVPYTADVTILA